jgi:hypothetical protein
MIKGKSIKLKAIFVFLVQSPLTFSSRHLSHINKQKEIGREAKAFVREVRISPNIKSLNFTPVLPRGTILRNRVTITFALKL